EADGIEPEDCLACGGRGCSLCKPVSSFFKSDVLEKLETSSTAPKDCLSCGGTGCSLCSRSLVEGAEIWSEKLQSTAQRKECLACGGKGCSLCSGERSDEGALATAPGSRRSGVASDLVRGALRQVLSSCKSASIGWSLGELMHHLMECKHAISSASKASRKTAVDFLFGETKKPATHRQCTIHMHDRNFEISTESLQLNSLDLPKHFDAWQKTTRKEAAAQGIRFRPGTSLQHVLAGKVEGEASGSNFATAVNMHFLNPSNPALHDSLFHFFRLLFQVSHELHRRGEGHRVLEACAEQMPQAAAVMKDVIEDTKYEIVDDARTGVLRHRFTCRWNLKQIRRRFGEDQYHIFRDRPMYDWRLESALDPELLALSLRELEEHQVEISYLVGSSGKLVWADADGRAREEVPSFWVSSFNVRVVNLRWPMACCGCFGTAHLPPLCFTLEACREPHPMFRVSCKEMGHFPMEWFYSPLFDMAHMRSLLVRHLSVECHFLGDECHLHVHFQLSKLSSILKRALKVFSSRVLDIFFGAVHEDPPVVLLAALGEDLSKLEEEL
ncbi:Uncharacterized protein (Fragment), partial [Durusdinium trenchii]